MGSLRYQDQADARHDYAYFYDYAFAYFVVKLSGYRLTNSEKGITYQWHGSHYCPADRELLFP